MIRFLLILIALWLCAFSSVSAATKFEVGNFSKETTGTANATQTVTLADSSITPVALILWTNGQTATGFAAGQMESIGFCTGTASNDNRAIAVASDDNVATTNTGKNSDAFCLIIFSNGTPTTAVTAILNSAFSAGSFQLKYPTNNTTAYKIQYTVIGGDVTNAKVLGLSSATVTGNRNDTGFGFDPEFVMFATSRSTTLGTATANEGLSIGAATSSAQWAFAMSATDNNTSAGTNVCRNRQFTDSCLLTITAAATPAVETQISFVGFISDGYTLNWTSVPGSAKPYAALALKGGQYKVGCFSKSTSGAPVNDDTNVGFTPTGVVLSSFHRASGTTNQLDAQHSFGATDGTAAHERSTWTSNKDGVINSDTNVNLSETKALILATNTSTLDSECDSDLAAVANSFRLTWTTNQAQADEICYAAFGSAVQSKPPHPANFGVVLN